MSKRDFNIQTVWTVIKEQIKDFPTPLPEYKFDKTRRWKFDYAIPEIKLAIELNGGVHRIKDRYLKDLEKLNHAAIQGWMVIQVDNNQVKDLSCEKIIRQAFLAAKEKIKYIKNT